MLAQVIGPHDGVLAFEGGAKAATMLDIAYDGGAITIDHSTGAQCAEWAHLNIDVTVNLITEDGAFAEAAVPATLVFDANAPEGILLALQPLDVALLAGDYAPPELIDGIPAVNYEVITLDVAVVLGTPYPLPGPGGTLVEGVSGVVQGSAELAEWSCPDPDVDACEGSSRDFMVGTIDLAG